MKTAWSCLALAWLAGVAVAQQPDIPPPTRPVASAPPVIPAQGESPEPLIINGKQVDQLTDNELRGVLRQKVRDIDMDDGDVEILYVAHGYPTVLRFPEPVLDVSNPDPGLFTVTRVGKMLEVAAQEGRGDTAIKVFFPGNKIRYFHVFAVKNYGKGDAIVTVNSEAAGNAQLVRRNYFSDSNSKATILKIIGSYETLVQEGAIRGRSIFRDEIFLKNTATGFTEYYRYRIYGALAYTFSYQNLTGRSQYVPPRKLRLNIGNMNFVPDYVSVNKQSLAPDDILTGVAIFYGAPFDPQQPSTLIWKP